ncbi:MAG TPA: TonB-dependent receptor, partial [Nevskiaceae bacterium]|nr:TonB-dependent receptor [Nevskiaceae bacterium]
RYKLAVLNVEYDLGWASAVSESAWVNKHSHTYLENTRNKVPNAPVGLVAIDGGGDSDTYSQELRLVSADQPGDRWRWIAGVFASRQEIHEVVNLDAGNSTLPAALNGGLLDSLIPGLGQEVDAMGNVSLIDLNPHVTIRELALFGNVTRKLGDAWELTLGGRLYKTDSFGTNLQQGVVFTALNGSPQFVQHGGVAEHGFNPQLSLAWHATDELMSYATVAKGFRVGGLQPGITLPTSKTQAPPTFKSDTIWSYELGQRTSWFGRTLNVDVAAFHIDWKNPQVQQPDSTSGVAYLDNAGGVKSDGAELNLRWLTPVGLMLSSGMTYAKTVTTEPFLSGTGQMSMPGDPWPYAPRLQTSTTLAYPLDLAGWVVTPSLTHAYLGKTVNNLGEQKPIFNYHQLDAQIGLANPQWSWAPQLTISVNNVLDTRGVTTNVTQGPSTDVNYCQPRTLIVHLGGQF